MAPGGRWARRWARWAAWALRDSASDAADDATDYWRSTGGIPTSIGCFHGPTKHGIMGGMPGMPMAPMSGIWGMDPCGMGGMSMGHMAPMVGKGMAPGMVGMGHPVIGWGMAPGSMPMGWGMPPMVGKGKGHALQLAIAGGMGFSCQLRKIRVGALGLFRTLLRRHARCNIEGVAEVKSEGSEC